MMKVKSKKAKGKIGRALYCFCLLTFAFCLSANAQSRDYFTDEEVELIRNAQQIDQRIEVLTKTIDRRFAVLNINVNGANPSGKEWGAPPKGTRVELFSDIRNILQKAIDDIDNLAARPDSMVIDPDDNKKKKKGFSDLFPKAVKTLAAAARRYEPALKQALDTTKDDREKGLISNSIDLSEDIIAAVQKLN